MTERDKPMKSRGGHRRKAEAAIPLRGAMRDGGGFVGKVYTEAFPRSVIPISSRADVERGSHPTQKPVALMEYLIRTYSQEG